MTAATEAANSGTPHNTKGDVFTSYHVEDFAVPKGRDEVWRFVSLRRLRGLHDGSFPEAGEPQIDVQAPEGSGVTTEQVAKDSELATRAGAPADRVAAQAWTSMKDVTAVHIPGDTSLDDPIVITVTGRGVDQTSFAGLVVEVGAGAKAVVSLRYIGSGIHADNVHFLIGDNANLTVVTDINWEDDAVHLSQHQGHLGRDAVLRHTTGTFGGNVVRLVPRVNFAGTGGDAEMLGIYFADDGQYFENRLLVDHSEPACRSNVLYKGALQGDPASDKPDTRTCWVGDILIRAGAENTDTYETNRNLVLSEGARADAIPNLEIETGEIANAGHAAAVGRFDDEQIYYLRSRGIPEEQARRLIIHGFFHDVINRIPVESIRNVFAERVATELELAENDD